MVVRRHRGFTLIELLIVVAIIGIIAAIAIPNLLAAINRGKQKRSMSDMRSIGSAVDSYQVDTQRPPNVGNGLVPTLSAVIQPTYIKRLPTGDGWQAPYFWMHDLGAEDYSIVCYGRGGVADNVVLGATTAFDEDIYFSDGGFTQFPEGSQN